MATTQPNQGDEQKKNHVPSEQISIHQGSSEVANPYAAALKLAAAHDGDDIDPLAEKKLVRKIDWFLMPLVSHRVPLGHPRDDLYSALSHDPRFLHKTWEEKS